MLGCGEAGEEEGEEGEDGAHCGGVVGGWWFVRLLVG